MRFKYEYKNEEERSDLLYLYKHLTLVEEHNITEGNFLVFSDNPEEDTRKVTYVTVPEEEINMLKQDSNMLKAQNKANADRADFHEEVLTEIIMTIHS